MNQLEYFNNPKFSDADLIQLANLYVQARWLNENDDASFLRPAIEGSFAVVIARAGTKIIGFGRAISDGFSDAYIQDVVVDKNCRCQGIGGEIVNRLVSILQNSGIDWIGLVGEPGTEEFYTKLGFKKNSNFTFMRYNG